VIYRLRWQLLPCLIAFASVASAAFAGAADSPRQSLDQAAAAARLIELSGDQSAARRSLALVLVHLDARAALDSVAGMRRPSDAARILGVAACAMVETNPEVAANAASTAGRLLLRIADPDRRNAEQLWLAREMAPLGEIALQAAPESPPATVSLAVVLGRAQSDPAAALAFLETWELTGAAADRSRAAIAPRFAETDPEQALEIAGAIASPTTREQTFWLLAELRPAAEGVGISRHVADPVLRSAILTSVAVRLAPEDPEAALLAAREVSVARESALAQLAVALAPTDEERALQLARDLSPRPRTWALRRIAVHLARTAPDRAQLLLAETGPDPETVRHVAVALAASDPARAAQLSRSLLQGEDLDAALTAIVTAIADSDPALAADLVWEITTPKWRSRAAASLARRLANTSYDEATSLIGLLPDRSEVLRLRARIAASLAPRDLETASRILQSLPESDYRSEAAMQAARSLITAGRAEEALQLAALGVPRDLALRWLLPEIAASQAGSPLTLAEQIESPYLRTLGLVDVAGRLLQLESGPLPAPHRALQVRPITEWEGA